MNGIKITFEDEKTTEQMYNEAIEHLRELLSLDHVIYSKLVYKTSSNLPEARRGYALFIPYMNNSLNLKIEQVTWNVALVTGCKWVQDEPQCMLVERTTLEKVVKNLSYALYGDNLRVKVQDWI